MRNGVFRKSFEVFGGRIRRNCNGRNESSCFKKVDSSKYGEVFAKELLHRIVSERENEIKRQEREDGLKRQERDELKRQEREDEIKRQERENEINRQEIEDEIKRQEREYKLEKLKIEASMMSNGFRRERNSQNTKTRTSWIAKIKAYFRPQRR
ncbi:hypothetical protein TNCV_1053371 [Trichonephila clavipes]|nr:hypothetical protein TNCV_1053371 [Trichonephila clavipes]